MSKAFALPSNTSACSSLMCIASIGSDAHLLSTTIVVYEAVANKENAHHGSLAGWSIHSLCQSPILEVLCPQVTSCQEQKSDNYRHTNECSNKPFVVHFVDREQSSHICWVWNTGSKVKKRTLADIKALSMV